MIDVLIYCIFLSVTVIIGIKLLTSILIKLNIYEKVVRFICPMCITFWIVLIYTQNIIIASVAAYTSFIIDKYIEE